MANSVSQNFLPFYLCDLTYKFGGIRAHVAADGQCHAAGVSYFHKDALVRKDAEGYCSNKTLFGPSVRFGGLKTRNDDIVGARFFKLQPHRAAFAWMVGAIDIFQ